MNLKTRRDSSLSLSLSLALALCLRSASASRHATNRTSTHVPNNPLTHHPTHLSVTVDELCHFITRQDDDKSRAHTAHTAVPHLETRNDTGGATEGGAARGGEATDLEPLPTSARRPSNFALSLEKTMSPQGLHEQV